jgi:hypothetical protein
LKPWLFYIFYLNKKYLLKEKGEPEEKGDKENPIIIED